MKKLLAYSFLAAMASAPAVSWAGSESGLYLGGSIGQSSINADDVSVEIDDSSTAYKAILGYNFGVVPLIDLAIEGDYRDFGSFKGKNGINKVDVTAYNLYGLAGFDIGPIGLFAKLGYSSTDGEFDLNDSSFSDSSSDITYGVGVKFQLTSFAVRAEYEAFEFDGSDDLYMFSVGALYTF